MRDYLTTMDSEAESQDSDDGRRFRFESTRKDAMTSSQYYKRARDMKLSRRRATSRECKVYEKTQKKHVSQKERSHYHAHREEYRSCETEKSANSYIGRNKGDRNKTASGKSFKASRHTQKRYSSYRNIRDVKTNDVEQRRSQNKSHDNKNCDKYRKYSGETDKSKPKMKCSDIEKLNKLQHTNFQEIPEAHDCKELNLSDFDIISDADGNSENFHDIIESADEIEGRRRNTQKHEVEFTNSGKPPSAHSCNHNNPDNVRETRSASTSLKSSSIDNSHSLLHEDDGLKKLHVKKQFENVIDKCEASEDKLYGFTTSRIVKAKTSDALKIIGPCLPDHLRNSVSGNVNNDDDSQFGPALPPYLQKRAERTVSLIPSCDIKSQKVEEDENDGVLGPLPADHPTLQENLAHQQLEYRAQCIKRELSEIGTLEEKKREAWMTELPTVNAGNQQLSARKFRTRAGPDLSDRSDWTDTPADRAKKMRQNILFNAKVTDVQSVKIPSKASNSREGKSLLEMHTLKEHIRNQAKGRAAKNFGKLPERRPFDRDVDLQFSNFDETRKNRILMKAAALDDRFAPGKI